jgi:hypothetical protein
MGLGAVALSNLLGEVGFIPPLNAAEAANPLAAKEPAISRKAKRVVHFFLNGGPSHVDTFDPKPALVKCTGSRCRWRTFAPNGRPALRSLPLSNSKSMARAASK